MSKFLLENVVVIRQENELDEQPQGENGYERDYGIFPVHEVIHRSRGKNRADEGGDKNHDLVHEYVCKYADYPENNHSNQQIAGEQEDESAGQYPHENSERNLYYHAEQGAHDEAADECDYNRNDYAGPGVKSEYPHADAEADHPSNHSTEGCEEALPDRSAEKSDH